MIFGEDILLIRVRLSWRSNITTLLNKNHYKTDSPRIKRLIVFPWPTYHDLK